MLNNLTVLGQEEAESIEVELLSPPYIPPFPGAAQAVKRSPAWQAAMAAYQRQQRWLYPARYGLTEEQAAAYAPGQPSAPITPAPPKVIATPQTAPVPVAPAVAQPKTAPVRRTWRGRPVRQKPPPFAGRYPWVRRMRPGGPLISTRPPGLRPAGMSGLGFTLHSTADSKYREALNLYEYFSDNLNKIADAGAQASWRSVVNANYNLLASAYAKLEAGDDTESFDLSSSIINTLTWQRQNFDADLAGRSFEEAAAEARVEVERLQTQVPEEERAAAEGGIVQYGAYQAGKAASGVVTGAVKGLTSGLGAAGTIVLIAGAAIAAWALLKR